MKVLVAGSPKWRGRSIVVRTLTQLRKRLPITQIVTSGVMPGAERFSEEWAIANDVPLDRDNGLQNLCGADALVAFLQFGDAATANLVELAQKRDLMVRTVQLGPSLFKRSVAPARRTA